MAFVSVPDSFNGKAVDPLRKVRLRIPNRLNQQKDEIFIQIISMLLLWALWCRINAFLLLFDGPSLRVAVNDWSIGAFLLLHRDHKSKNRWSLSCSR